MKNIRFVGLDVHAETVTIAIAEANGEVRSLGTIPNREESIRKLVRKLAPVEQLHACYEAGPTGYILLGVKIVGDCWWSVIFCSTLSGCAIPFLVTKTIRKRASPAIILV